MSQPKRGSSQSQRGRIARGGGSLGAMHRVDDSPTSPVRGTGISRAVRPRGSNLGLRGAGRGGPGSG